MIFILNYFKKYLIIFIYSLLDLKNFDYILFKKIFNLNLLTLWLRLVHGPPHLNMDLKVYFLYNNTKK